ncbi:ABC transporter, substrate-binding protein, family 5 [Bacteriovorax sp. BAL6_X]|uniref:ABC transporter substrate-binding protein n=1 Tax=Bacteriovorax sp. BAL6_X TaxID=1201290 RepID=UPI0003856531|nr:ABC transporter substrate-binding protein [Bacteriovorax sp. BAL6_X]EPZ50291.1 ABC transporter, substrate-binding protein, family 5 [Bacteriovorax sp. BAL6_X]
MFRFLSFLLFIFLSSMGYGASLNIAISSSPNSLSPFFSTDANSQNINRLVNASLIDFDSNMQPICQLCESFKEYRTVDSYKIRFKLKSNLKFSNGATLTSKDVEKSHFYFTETEKIKSIFRFAFGNIKEVKIIDELTFELIYKGFGLDHLPNLVLFKIIQIPNYEKLEKVEMSDIIGAGDYKIAKIAPLQIDLKSLKADHYDLNFVVVKDETTLSLKLIKGEIDLSVANISPRKVNYLEKNSDVNVQKVLGTDYNYIGLNQKKELLQNKNVRKALSHLIPRTKIIKYKFKDNAVASNGLFAESFKNFYIDTPVDDFNPKKAFELFNKAGFERKNGVWYDNNGKTFSLTWKTSSNKFQQELVTIIKNEFEKFGLVVNVVPQEWGTFLRGIKRGEYDLYLGRWVGFTGQDMLKFAFYSENMAPKGANRVFFDNKDFDNLIKKAEQTINKKKEVALYKKANQVVNEQYPYISLWHPNVIWVMSKCIKLKEIYPNGNFLVLKEIENVCKN